MTTAEVALTGRPTVGSIYYAPVSDASGSMPLALGERRGVTVAEPGACARRQAYAQGKAIAYLSRESAEDALRDPAVWHPNNAARMEVAAVRYVGGARPFRWGSSQPVNAAAEVAP